MADTGNEMGLVAPVTNGVLNYKATAETKSATTRGSSELGKDAFLQLLVCQMQNQDPINPNTDTEFVSQLAQFSSLEQLQNLSGESEKSQAFSLVGKYVIFQKTDSDGKTTYPEGVVDFVNMSGKNIKISVNGSTYDYDELYTVVNDTFYLKENIPKVGENIKLKYNAKAPEDMSFEADFGKNEYAATEAAVVINGEQLGGKYVSCKEGRVTIDKEALAGIPNGTYSASVVFNNSIFTTVNDRVTFEIFNQDE